MSNDLIVSEDVAYSAELAAMLGVDGAGFSGGGLGVPQLKINYNHEDDDGFRLPAGSFMVTVPGDDDQDAVTVYAKTCVFRPFLNRFQFSHYDPDGNDGAGQYINKSVFVPDLNKSEALDELGGVRCGKLTTKQYKELGGKITPAQATIKSQVSVYRVVFGTVSMTGVTGPTKDENGKEVPGVERQVDNLPVVFRLRGSNFSGLGDILKAVDGQKKLPFNVALTCSTRREKKGTLTFYIVQFEYDQELRLSVSKEDIALVNQFNTAIRAENEAVIKKHKVSLEAKDTSQAEDVSRSLDNDFDDEIPF